MPCVSAVVRLIGARFAPKLIMFQGEMDVPFANISRGIFKYMKCVLALLAKILV